MAASDLLIVEDGTGIAGANTYVSYSEFETYLILYNEVDTALLQEETLVAALIKAADYIESHSYRGVATYTTQMLSFPRRECVPHGSGMPLPFDAIPYKLKRAQMAAALIAARGIELQPIQTVGTTVLREKVGQIETEYADNASNGTTSPTFSNVDNLLSDFLSYGGAGRYSIRTVRV